MDIKFIKLKFNCIFVLVTSLPAGVISVFFKKQKY